MLIRKNHKSQNGWNNGDIETLFCLFNGVLIQDGDIPSKESRDHLADGGYIDRRDGYQWLTYKGWNEFLTSPIIAESAVLRRAAQGHSPFARSKRQMN